MELTLRLSRSPKTRSHTGAQPPEQRASTTWANPAEWLKRHLGIGSDANVLGPYGTTSALRLSYVYSCVRKISESLGSLPVYLYRQNADGSRELVKNDLYDLVHHRPHPAMSSTIFYETIQGQALTAGNGYAYIIREASTGRPQRLQYLESQDVTVSVVQGIPYYHVEGIAQAIPHYDMLHIRAFGTEMEEGISPIAQHRLTVEQGLHAQTRNAKYYKNGGPVKGYLSLPGALDADRRKQLSQEWDENYGGANAFKTPIVHSGGEFKPFSLSQRDAQFIETMKLTRADICGIFNVNPSMIGDNENANFSVMEQMHIQFVTDTLRPWIKKYEQELNYKLLTSRQRSTGLFFEFNMNALLRGDTNTRKEYYASMMERGVLSPNEVRTLEGFNPREGGDRYFTQVNTQTQEQTRLAEEKTKAEIDNLSAN